MPKQPAGISKTKRIQALIEVLDRWGSLDKGEITSRVAALLAVEPESIERAIYRDLEELVSNLRIKVFSRSAAGSIVDETELDGDKPYKNYWYTEKHSPFDILGVGGVRKLGGNVLATQNLLEGLQVFQVSSRSIDNLSQMILFKIGSVSFGLKYLSSLIPFSFVVSRNTSIAQSEFEEMKRELSGRLCVLLLPDADLTSIKSGNYMGHCMIRFSEKEVRICDESSTNGTFLAKGTVSKDRVIFDFIDNGRTRKPLELASTEVFKRIDHKGLLIKDFPRYIKLADKSLLLIAK
ncbi:MAG: hypothetical protein IPL83_07215 [Bdellovibrionales bacterium]|nr:hypothetical protein [Bdellovibrionales bacterium]